MSRKALRSNAYSYAFLAPNLTVFIVFMLVPMVWAIWLSLQSGGLLSGLTFTGLSNYPAALKDELFLTALRNTAVYAAMVIPSVIGISLFLAWLLDQRIRFKSFFKAAIFFPLLSPIVVAAVIWTFMVHPEFGPLNYPLRWLGQPPVAWLGDPNLALVTITIVMLWNGIGFYTIVYVAALGGMPTELYEAAFLDGAGAWRTFFHVTLPLLRPTLLFTTVMATIWNFQLFDAVYVMTQGGPIHSTTTVAWYIYSNAFRFEKVGLAATMSVMLMAVILVLAITQMRYLSTEVEY